MEQITDGGHAGLEERNGGGCRRESHKHEERKPNPRSGRTERRKHLRQRDEHEPRSSIHRRMDSLLRRGHSVAAVLRDQFRRHARLNRKHVDDRDDHQTCNERDQRIEDLNAAHGTLNRVLALHIGPIRDHDAHGERERVEHLSHRAENRLGEHRQGEMPIDRERLEVGLEIVFEST